MRAQPVARVGSRPYAQCRPDERHGSRACFACGGISPCPSCPNHVSGQRRVICPSDCRRLARADVLDHRLLQERSVARGGPVPEATERRPGVVDVEGRHADDAGTVADHRLVRVRRKASNLIRGPLGLHAAKREHGVKFNRVRRNASLAVLEVEERDPSNASLRAEPGAPTCLRHLPTAKQGRTRRTGGRR